MLAISLPLLQTKLYSSPPRLQWVHRHHLLARLRDQAGRPLTLVCAPAGFGKTTLVSDWMAQSDSQRPGCRLMRRASWPMLSSEPGWSVNMLVAESWIWRSRTERKGATFRGAEGMQRA